MLVVMWTSYKKILLALILSKLVHQIWNIFSTWCVLTWNSQCSQISENVYHSITLIFTRPNFSPQEMVPPLTTRDVELTWLLINQKISRKLFLKKNFSCVGLKKENTSTYLKGDKSFVSNIVTYIFFLLIPIQFSLFTGFLNFSKGYTC